MLRIKSATAHHDMARNSYINTLFISNILYSINMLPVKPVTNISSYHLDSLVVVLLSYLFGSRVSEVLAIKRSDYISPDRFIVSGKKRSSDYIIYFPYIHTHYKLSENGNSPVLLFDTNYSRCWSLAKRLGLSHKMEGHHNNVVCHYGRHDIAKKIALVKSDKSARNVLRHRSKASLANYIHE